MFGDFDKIRKLYKFGRDLTMTDLYVLLQSAKTKKYEKKELLLAEGSHKNDVFYIKKGLVRCYHVNDKGDEVTYLLIPEYNVIANIDMILFNKSSKYYFEALEPTTVFCSDYDVLEEIVANNPKLEANRKYLLRRLLSRSFQRVESFVLHSPEERYLMFLKENPDIINRVPDKYIAHVLGITPVSLSRIRKRIADKKNKS